MHKALCVFPSTAETGFFDVCLQFKNLERETGGCHYEKTRQSLPSAFADLLLFLCIFGYMHIYIQMRVEDSPALAATSQEPPLQVFLFIFRQSL